MIKILQSSITFSLLLVALSGLPACAAEVDPESDPPSGAAGAPSELAARQLAESDDGQVAGESEEVGLSEQGLHTGGYLPINERHEVYDSWTGCRLVIMHGYYYVPFAKAWMQTCTPYCTVRPTITLADSTGLWSLNARRVDCGSWEQVTGPVGPGLVGSSYSVRNETTGRSSNLRYHVFPP